MADSKNSKISELIELTDPSNADFIPIVDTANQETKKISYTSLVAALNTDDDSYSKTEANALIAAVQSDVDQNEADADTAIAAVQADVDQNEADADAAIAALQADVDQNESDADAAIAALQADVDQNESDADAAIAANENSIDSLSDANQQLGEAVSTANTNIATNTANIATNTANIATNTASIATKAPTASPTFTGTTNFNGSVDFNSTVLADNGLVTTGDITVNSGKIITNEIQCKGTTVGTAQPINYDSLEHRFRDYDAAPSNLMVIKKINGKNGARVGINVPASQDPKSALHVAYGGSTDGLDREALRVSGGAFLNEWVRVGHFTDTTRDAILHPTNGTIIYNEEHHEFQGYIGGAQGINSRWQAFTMQNAAT